MTPARLFISLIAPQLSKQTSVPYKYFIKLIVWKTRTRYRSVGTIQMKKEETSYHYIIAGWLGGCNGLLVGHPWDTVRIRLQTQGGSVPMRYNDTLHCIKNIVHTESFLGLYKGFLFPLLGFAGLQATRFGMVGNTMKFLQPEEKLPRLGNSLIAGACGGAAAAFIASPIELVKINMQMQNIGRGSQFPNHPTPHIGPLRFSLELIERRGVAVLLTKGLWTTLFRDTPSDALYFFTLDAICYSFLTENQRRDRTKNSNLDLHPFKILLAGGIAGTVGWCSLYPLDVIKSRLQADVMSDRAVYKGLIDCFKKTISSEGIRPLFAGFTLTAVTAFPINAVAVLTVMLYLKLVGTSLII